MFGNHLAGIYEKALNANDSWETRLKKVKAMGFDFLEISIDESDERLERLNWDRKQTEELRRLSIEAEVPIMSMCLSGHRRYPFGSARPEIRAKAKTIMLKAIDFAFAMGIRVIQLAGYDVYYEASTPQSVKYFKEAMAWSADMAARKEVMLAMEIMDTPFMNSVTKHMGYESMINSPWYKMYPDIGNLNAWSENDPYYELSKGIGSIVAIHLKDTVRVQPDKQGVFKGVKFGEGCVNFKTHFSELEKLGYTGPYVIEMWHQQGTDDVRQIRDAVQWLDGQFKASCFVRKGDF